MSHKLDACALIALALALIFCGLATADEIGLVWSTYLGEGDTDEAFGIAVDDSGNTYLTGFTNSADFPTTAGAFDTTHNGIMDVFVAKLSPAGSALDYATLLGGGGIDDGYGIAVDDSGNAYLTGLTNSADFPTTAGAFDTTFNGNCDAFVAKFNSEGSVLAYCTFLGGGDYDRGESIAVDGSGNAYLTGWTGSDDFPATSGAFSTVLGALSVVYRGRREEDAFVVKLNPTGGDLAYATFLGGVGEDWGKSIAVDGSGNAYVGALTYSEDFPTTPGAFDTTYNGSRDACVVKLNPTGSDLVYATFLGGSFKDWSQGIVVDDAGYACLAGVTTSVDFPATAGAFDVTYNGYFDGFLAKLNPAGSDLVFATYLGGSGEERSTGIALDGSGNVYVAGWTRSVDFPTTAGAYDTTYNGGYDDVFVARLNPTGSDLAYATFLGGDSTDVCRGIVVDDASNAYVAGWTESKNFPTTAGVFDTVFNGKYQAFVAKLDLSGPAHPRGVGQRRGHR